MGYKQVVNKLNEDFWVILLQNRFVEMFQSQLRVLLDIVLHKELPQNLQVVFELSVRNH